MMVYVVCWEGNYGKEIDKIFAKSEEAEAYCAEQNKLYSSFYHFVEIHQVF